jgi:hypothetical protein
MKMPEAMRFVGLDEVRVANEYKSLIESSGTGDNPKLKLDILKECSKQLDPAPRQAAQGEDPVEIVIDVPRPVRDAPATQSEVSGFDPDAASAPPVDPAR